MADNKKTPPKKTSGQEASEEKTSDKKTSVNTAQSKRRASRPPTIELKAEEVGGKASADKSHAKKSQEKGQKKQNSASDKKDNETEKQQTSQPSPTRSKAPLISGGLAGLIAGGAGGLLAGFILTGMQPDAALSPDILSLKERVQKIETGQKGAKPESKLISRLEKAEGDTRFINSQLKTLQGEITTLKDQVTLFAGKVATTTEGGEEPQQVVIDVSGLEAKITDLQAKIKERTDQATKLSGELALMQKNIEAQQATLDTARQQTELSVKENKQTSQDLQKAYADLEKSVDQKIDKLYQAGGDNRIRAAALSLSLRELVDAAQGSKPFVKELQAVSELVADQNLIDSIMPYAGNGVPDYSAIKVEFAQIRITPAEVEKTPTEDSLLDKIVSNAKSVVRVSKISDAQTEPSDPVKSMAQRLEANDLDGVIKASEDLDKAGKDAYKDWLLQVKQRRDLNAQIKNLQHLTLAEIGRSTNKKNSSVVKAPAQKTEDAKEPEDAVAVEKETNGVAQ